MTVAIALAILAGIWLASMFLEAWQEAKFERFRHAYDITPANMPVKEMLP